MAWKAADNSSGNGPKYVSGKPPLGDCKQSPTGQRMAWAEKAGIHIPYIHPGKPKQNTYIELYNRRVSPEWLDQNIFETIVPLSE